MEGEEETWKQKLEAGRAKFAYLRQRKAKANVAQPQKKASQRKGSAVHTHDLPQEEHALAAQGLGEGVQSKAEDSNLLESKAEDSNLRESTTETEGSADLFSWDVLNDLAAEEFTINSAAEYRDLDAKMCEARAAELENRLLEKQEAVEGVTAHMDELQEQLTQHSDSMNLQETAVQEENEVIGKLTSCLQQEEEDQDDLQEEASCVAGQSHELQLPLHQNTDDKENLLAQVEEDMKDTVQQLHKSIGEKEQHIKSLQSVLTSERLSLHILQRTLALRDSEITELKNEIALCKMKEQQRVEELKIGYEKDICRQLENLRAKLEKCHRREIAEAEQVYEEQITLKYKNEFEQLKKELCALNSEEHIQNLNGIIIDLNNVLHESEINKDNLRRKLENQQEDFQREKSEIETKYKDLIDSLKSQLSDAEEQVKEAQRYKEEKQLLSEEIQKLNIFIQELNEKQLNEAEKSIPVRQKPDEGIVSNKKLMKLYEKQILPEVSQLQSAEFEEMWCIPHQMKGKDELVHKELEFQHDLRVDSSSGQLEETKNSNITENNHREKSSEGDKLYEEHLSELELLSGAEGILAKYLISTETPEESYVSSTSEGYAIEGGRCSSLNSSALLEPSRDFIPSPLNFGLDKETCPSSLAPETFEEAEVGAEAFISFLGDNSLQQNKISDHSDVKDDETACLIERCVKLAEQLREKESALKKAYEETQEAVDKREKVMAELSCVRVELHEEREARISCEKELLRKTQEEKELENEIMFLVRQQGKSGGQADCAVEPLTPVSKSLVTWQEMVKDLVKEREMLMVQLQTREQLVKDAQEQKTGSDSVASEVQSGFRCQLAALQSQRDQMQSQFDAQKAENQTIAELLGQKTVSEEALVKEQELLKAEISNKEQDLALLLKEKTALEERLSDVEEDLVKAEKAVADSACIIEDLEKNIHELHTEVKNLKEMQECERLVYEDRLNFSNLEIHKLNAEIKARNVEYSEKKSQLTEEITCLKKAYLELETRFQSAQEAQSELVKYYKEEIDKMETQRLAELAQVSLKHKKEIEELDAEIKDKVEKQQKLEEEKKEQIALIKKIHEREHDREISELVTKHEEEMEKLRAELNKEQERLLDELRQQMAATHKAETEQAQLQSQALHSLELEALRLSLNNMHISQRELMQSNLRKEKETALVELREMLNDKRAQEVAILQSRHHMEWEKVKEQSLREKEDLKSKYQQELVDQRKKIELEMEEARIQALETLKKDWELESDLRLKNMCEELSEKHETEMMELQKTMEKELEKVKAELSRENEQSKIKCVELEKQYQLAITKLQEELETEYNRHLEDMKMKSQEKEQNLQKQLEELQVTHEELKTRSQEEIRELWSQLDSTRANRQELSELKEQLLARASRVEEIEHLKQEFEQQHQQRKIEHETELEQLRLYFENKLIVAEENYREELTLLHQRLQDLKDYSLSELDVSQDQAGDISLENPAAVFEEAAEKERRNTLGQLNQQLEQHQEELACLQVELKEQHRHELDSLRSSLTLQYKKDLMKMTMDLSDKYITEIEEIKRKHSLELEQLRAQLSEEHIKEITKLHLQSAQDAARQVEMEVAERASVLEEEHKAKLSLLQSEKQHIAELSEEIEHLKDEITKQKDSSVQNEKHLKEEMQKVEYKIAEDHKNQLREAREEVQKIEAMYKEKEKKWKCEIEDQRIQAEETLSSLRIELQNKAECEKQNLQKEFERREAEMNQLQDHQAAKILELEKLVKEQQNNLQQLEDSLASAQTMQKSQEQYDADLQAAKALMEKEMEKVTVCLKEECALKLMEAQSKFMEEHEAVTKKFTTEQEILLQELKNKHDDELELQSQQLQEKHKQQILSLTTEFQTKHQAEIETLKSTLESKQQIQLEACVAELQAKHQAQINELEAKHLSNLDSLESSYLSEIQNIRDEHSQVLEKLQLQHVEQLHEKDKIDQARLIHEIEMLKIKHAEELQLAQNNLKIELAAVHVENLKAMAVETEEAHKDDINTALQNQRRLLEEEKRLALDALREEVVHMEEKHRKALQELQDLHETEIKKHEEEFSRELEKELEKLKAQHEHEQEMYASASASEVETVRTGLLAQFEDVKLKQQLQFQEEIELLKCQSEVLLEQQIAQLKDEFEAEKKASLHDKEQMLIQEREKAQAAHQKEQEMLTAQLQEKAAIITQLEKRVESLNHEIEETNSELETLLQQRDRENQEGGNLVAMLRSDIEQSKDERKKLQESYQHVLKLLTELVKATIAVEDLICSRIGLCLDDSLAFGDSRESHSLTEEKGFIQDVKAKEKHHLEKDELLDETLTEHNQLSPVTDEGSELSQYLCQSVFVKPELACENEEMILKICHRLHTAVGRLLDLVAESTKQLEKMHENHAQFEEEFSRRNRETAQVVSQHQELMECLSEESEAKNQLALELHKAEGIIEGYVAEKAALEEALNLKEESERRLVVELESMRERFQELTKEQAILGTPVGNVAQKEDSGLLKEVEFLAKEKLELQCQAEKDHSNLRSQMKDLEVELEEQLHSNQDLATQLLEVAELKQQIQVLEKQLKKQRQFMDEQAIEREHERDDFQQEIQKLEEQLKLSGKSQPSGEPRECRNYELILQVESLQAEIKQKMDDYNKAVLEKEQQHQEIAARDKEIEKLVAQIRELECNSAESSKTVHNLEQQLQRMKKVETELKQDKEALQQQQYNNLIQISALQSKLDEARHRVPVDSSSAPMLKEQLQAEQETLHMKETEIASLLDQLEQYRDNLISKNEEILQLNLQLEMQKNLSTSSISQLQVENAHLKEDLTKLNMKQNQDVGMSDSSALSFPQALLKEKNQEIDYLNEQMRRLQHELENTLVNKVVEDQKSEIAELRSLVEHLRSDQERLRKDKDEEVEQLHGVIEKLQKELAQFEPVCHEVRYNQDNLYQLALGKPVENLQSELRKGLVHCQSDPDPNRRNSLLLSQVRALQEELELISTAKEAMQQQLKEKELQFKMEVEILEKKCQNLQELSEQHVAELTSLRIQYNALQEECTISTTQFSQREVEARMTSRIQELEDAVRAREANILEKDMQMKAMADQREADTAKLQYLTKQTAELQTELEKRDASQGQDVYSLQSQVSRLDFQVQAHNKKEVAYQREINELQGSTAKLKDQMKAYVKELEALRLERGELISQLELYKLKEQRDHEETNLLKVFCQRERKDEALKKGKEELEGLEANVDQSFAALASATDKPEKDEVMFDLTAHSINPKTQIKQSQENILTQELDGINNTEKKQDLKKHCQQMLEIHQTPESPKRNLNTSEDFQNFIAGRASWDSPEIVRKQDISMELQPVLHLTPLSEAESTSLEMMHTRSPVPDANSVFLGYSNLYENGSEEAAVGVDRKSPAFSASSYSVDGDQDVEKILIQEADNLTPSDLQGDVRSRTPATDVMSDGYGSNTSSNLAAKLKQELQTSDHLDASFMAYLQYRGMFPDTMESMRDKEILSPQLKTLLKMVYEESCKILALSEHPFGFRELENVHQSRVEMEEWQKEGLALLDAIQSLKDYLNEVADRGDKEFSGIVADWRGELLQAVQSIFEKERNVLHFDLKCHFSNRDSGDEGSLMEKLEHIVKQELKKSLKEEQRQMVVEQLFSSDRKSLLAEIQDLRAQLRMTHLQNQEKLQQLQETLTEAEVRGSKQEHHLRRKVELLEYKLQQEKTIVSDLQSTVSEERKRASETCDLLNQEKAALKSELHGSKQENERLQKSLQELQREVSQLCFELEKKEKDLTAALEDLKTEHLKETELQGLLEEQQLQRKKAEDEKTKVLEELQAALELQLVQNSQLAVSLEHEQTVTANLRKELQIEHSRCEALLSQEQAKLLELQRDLDAEKNRSLELLNSLNHERVLTEQLSTRVKEGASCQHRGLLLEQAFVQELQAQLEEERSRTIELAAIIDKMHQKAICSKRQLEAEVQVCCEEAQKEEREISDKLRATLQSLQDQKQEVIRSLEVQKEREAKLKADWEQLQSIFKIIEEQDKTKKEEREHEQRQQQQTEREKGKDWQRDQERLALWRFIYHHIGKQMEKIPTPESLNDFLVALEGSTQNLEQQHQRDEQRIKELQEILAVLEERERNLPSTNLQQELLCTVSKDRNAKRATTKKREESHLQQQQQQLEKIRQQLLFVAVHLNDFIYKTVDKTVNDWSASNNEAVASLLQTLKKLKSDLLSLPASQIVSIGDTNSVQELEREAWQRERNILQNALKQAESELAKAAVETENKPVGETSSPKLQRLYRKYLRAESYRKALVYQKKYLLLLLGGFQECEQATLSLIARMGVYPCPADLQLSASRSRPFTKFRCAVRAIVAVSRLKFLVKKWNKVGRKSTQGETISHSVGGNTASGARTEILKEQQPPAAHMSSPPTRDTGLRYRTSSARLVSHSPRSSYCLHNRSHPSTSSASEKSFAPTQDPEQSLTEYIRRLEVIQQRLGGLQPGHVPGLSHQRNMKK